MKNIFKKNQIIIAALAIMIIIAGYLNFSRRNLEDKTAEVGSNETVDYDTYAETSEDDITDGDTVSLNEDEDAVGVDLLEKTGIDPSADSEEDADATASKETAAADEGKKDKKETADNSDEDAASEEVAKLDVTDTGEVVAGEEKTADAKDKTADSSDEESAPGEAILVSTTIASNYFANAKLEREQKRSISKETLKELVNNDKLSEAEKADAIAELLALTAKGEMENATETLLEAKGFSDAIVIMSEEGNIDVIINAPTVTEQEVAQVEDIVKRQTGADSKDIVISPVVLEE
jgi:stage III sporulation protein AH